MPAAEITAAVTSIRAAYDLTKAMIALRDADKLSAQARELNVLMLDILEKGIGAREAQSAQLEEIGALKAEIVELKAWGAEKEWYELKQIGTGAVAYTVKPAMREGKTPHWLCPNCYAQNKKAFLQSANKLERGRLLVTCNGCGTTVAVTQNLLSWPE